MIIFHDKINIIKDNRFNNPPRNFFNYRHQSTYVPAGIGCYAENEKNLRNLDLRYVLLQLLQYDI